MKIVSILSVFCAINSVNSANILCYFTAPSYSHQITFQPIWKELSLRGHKVTVITPDPLKDNALKNLTEIDIHDLSYNIWNKYNISKLGTEKEVSSTDLKQFLNAILEIMDTQLSHPEVKKIINNEKKEKFDLCIVEYLLPGPYPLRDVYNCPMVAVSSMPLQIMGHDLIGNPSHPVLNPDLNLPYSRNLSFFERLNSVLYSIFGRIMFHSKFDIVQNTLDKHYKNVRSVTDVAKEISLVFVNANPVLNAPRPNVPAVIEFSGIHIKPEKPLPKDLQVFMDEAKEGVIYISFGSNVKSNLLPENKIRIILNTLAELPYKVLWKFESDNLPGKPNNVEIRKWVPQQDILRHPNLKLFITQGGMQSLDEAMYTKTPVVVVPFFADQYGNARKVEEIAMGKSLRFSELNKADFKATILEVLKEKYALNAKEFYEIVTDKPVGPVDNIIWWIEFVLRHKGAKHLKSPAIDMPLHVYFMLDVFGFLLAICCLSIFIIYKIFCIVIRKVMNRKCNKLKNH